MQITNNNNSGKVNFQKLYIKNISGWDKSCLEKFRNDGKIKYFVKELDKKGADLVAHPYNYVDSGNKPKNFGVLMYLKLKNNVKSKSGLRQMMMKAYHCTIEQMLEGFNPSKSLKTAKKDIMYLKNGSPLQQPGI